MTWDELARPEQRLPEGDWRTWLVLAGRGWGKDRTGAEAVASLVERRPDLRVGLVGPTAGDVRHMVEGPAGLLEALKARLGGVVPFSPSRARVSWAGGTGCAVLLSAEARGLDRWRGLELDLIWGNEPGVWAHEGEPVWGELLRAKRRILTGTPRVVKCKRCGKERLVRILERARRTFKLVETTGSTEENVQGLSAAWLEALKTCPGDTRRELDAVLSTDCRCPLPRWRGP